LSVQRTKIVTLTDEITALGLKLAGIGEVSSIKDGETGTAELTAYANDPDIAVLIITEDIGDKNRVIINRITQKPWPVIVEIPGPDGKKVRESSTLKELVKRALGIEMEI